jgi:hypothetical protein
VYLLICSVWRDLKGPDTRDQFVCIIQAISMDLSYKSHSVYALTEEVSKNVLMMQQFYVRGVLLGTSVH